MNPVFAALKGTAMKDKRKRAAGGGGGSPSTGTYPDNFTGGGLTFQLGVGSLEVGSRSAPSPNLHASVFYRDGLFVEAGNPTAPLQITNAAGQNVNSPGNAGITISDYIATDLRGESVVSKGNPFSSNAVQPGAIYVPGIVGNNLAVKMLFSRNVAVDNNSGAWNGGVFSVSASVNTANLSVSGVTVDSMSQNPPAQNGILDVDIDTTGITSTTEIILEFRIQAGSKQAGTQITNQASPADIGNGSALKVGSCYVKIVFL